MNRRERCIKIFGIEQTNEINDMDNYAFVMTKSIQGDIDKNESFVIVALIMGEKTFYVVMEPGTMIVDHPYVKIADLVHHYEIVDLPNWSMDEVVNYYLETGKDRPSQMILKRAFADNVYMSLVLQTIDDEDGDEVFGEIGPAPSKYCTKILKRLGLRFYDKRWCPAIN